MDSGMSNYLSETTPPNMKQQAPHGPLVTELLSFRTVECPPHAVFSFFSSAAVNPPTHSKIASFYFAVTLPNQV